MKTQTNKKCDAKKHPCKCCVKFCRGSVFKTSHSPYCSKHRTERFKERFPLKRSFMLLKSRAKQRGHEFALTFDDYERFANATGYAKLKGKHAKSLSIHRIDNDKGYRIDNIAAVTLSDNSRYRYAPMPEWMKQAWEDEKRQDSNPPF